MLSSGHFADQEGKRRLLREARAASGLNHPNIVTVYEIGLDGGVDFIAMECVEGKRLDELIPPKGMRAGQVMRYAVQIVGRAGQGPRHGDFASRPEAVEHDGHSRGPAQGAGFRPGQGNRAARRAASPFGQVTEEGTVAGTAACRPNRRKDASSTCGRILFSFGTVLYEMAAGRRPFAGETRMALLHHIVNEDPQPPGQMAPLPPELEKLILRCLHKDPARRYQTMADLKVALEDLQTEELSGPQAPQRHPRIDARKLALIAALAAAAVAAVTVLPRGA